MKKAKLLSVIALTFIGSLFLFSCGKEEVPGPQGEQGIQGETGIGIESVEKSGSEGLVDIYTITFSDGTTSTFAVTNGKDGVDGTQGIQGIQGEPGEDGHTPVITIQEGYWYIDGENTNVLAEGIKGDTGNGVSDVKLTNTEGLVDTYTITFTNGTTSTFTVTNGKDGVDGKQGVQGIQGVPGEDGHTPVITIENGYWHIDGVSTLQAAQGVKGETGNGISSITKTSTEGLVDVYTITFTDGNTSLFTVTNGAKGDQGEQGIQGIQGVPGNDGHTPVITIQDGYWYIDGVSTLQEAQGVKGETGNGISSITKTNTSGLIDTYTITYTDGTTSTFTVTNGKDGKDGAQGIQGEPGKDGHTPVITIQNGYWYIDGVCTLQEAQGVKGDTGNGISSIIKTSTSGLVDTYTVTYTDGTTSTFTVTNGKDGVDGEQGIQGIQGEKGEDGHTPVITIQNGYWYIDGENTNVLAEGIKGDTGNGISSIIKTNTNGLIDTYTITYTDGTTSTFTVTNGKDGKDGEQGIQGIQGVPGEDGHTPVITIQDGYWYIDGVNTLQLAQGPKGENGTGILSVEFNELGQLVITLTDGTVLEPVDLPKKEEHIHTFTEWESIKDPTCTQKGLTLRFCEECNYTETKYVDAEEHTYENGYCTKCNFCNIDFKKNEGKTVSILGDSISTYTGVSNDSSVNSTLANGAIYYTPGKWDVYQEDTWWQQTIDALGMELLVNNSWSGSCVLHTRHDTVGSYIDRCVQLHNEFTNEEPDIIFVFISANDFSYFQDTLGDSNINYDELIILNEDGSYTYNTPTTSCEAYAIMLHKMKNRYKNADIYCLTSLARRYPDKDDGYADVGQPTIFNKNIMDIANQFGCEIIDLEKCGIEKEAEVFDLYIADGRTHPNKLGMDLITNYICSNILESNLKTFEIKYDLNNVTIDNNRSSILSNSCYSSSVEIPSLYTIDEVTIIMNDIDITKECFNENEIIIDNVNGNIVIKINASREKLNFNWEVLDNTFKVNDNNNNVIEKISGTIENGIIKDGLYNLSYPVELKHRSEWSIEWKCSGDWRGVMLSTELSQTSEDMIYITRTVGGMLCFGTYRDGKYHNYGIDISYLDTNSHIYQIKNKVTDNDNMLYLYIDGVEIGPMNNYFIGSQNQSTTVNWVSGKDYRFNYIGIEGHPLNNCKLEYLIIHE